MGISKEVVTVNTDLLKLIYHKLLTHFGTQHWWPAKTSFEMMVGAILVQNTSWANTEKATARLRRERVLSYQGLKGVSLSRLAQMIKPAGYFNIKARRLKNFIHFLAQETAGRVSDLKRYSTAVLREKLLSVNGVGPETADSMLLYAFHRPVFVVDAYTRRILLRHQWISACDDYSTIQNMFMSRLDQDQQMFNEYHALLVCLAKHFCQSRPSCLQCPLQDLKTISSNKGGRYVLSDDHRERKLGVDVFC